MRKCINLFNGILISLASISAGLAQGFIDINPADRIELSTNEPGEQVQWQISREGIFWDDIPGATNREFATEVTEFPAYFRAQTTGDCEINYSDYIKIVQKFDLDLDTDGDGIPDYLDNCPNTANADQKDSNNNGTGDVCGGSNQVNFELWSNPSTWGSAGKPKAGDIVKVPADKFILLDENTPELGGIRLMGKLEFKRMDVELKTKNIMVHGGELLIGTEEKPFLQKATITLTDTDMNNSVHEMGTRGIMLMDGGKMHAHGRSPQVVWTKINEHVEEGGTTLTLDQTVDWKVGDEIVVGPTDFYEAGNGKSVTQKFTITAIDGNKVITDKPSSCFLWGKLQYATNEGISLSPTNIISSELTDTDSARTPRVLDQRAPVGNLSRNIVIQAPNDEVWKTNGFGAHIMVMRNCEAYFDGVEIKRGGQRGRIMRYPFHWHMLSYEGTKTLGDVNGQYFKNSVVNQSAQRGIVVHGTNGALVQSNVVFHVKGHGIFTEDAVERRNIFDRNLVLHIRSLEETDALKVHETQRSGNGASGLWLSNPDNTVTNNHFADCQRFGMWLAFPRRPFGESREVLHTDGDILAPFNLPMGKMENNTTHSNNDSGVMLDKFENDEAGNTKLGKYQPASTGRVDAWPYKNVVRHYHRRLNSFKNEGHAFWDRADDGTTIEAVAADNKAVTFAGAGFRGLITRSLVVGRSLNNDKNGTRYDHVKSAFATYHHTFDMTYNVVMNYPLKEGRQSGMYSTVDYYIRPVEKGQIRNIGNISFASHPGFKTFYFRAEQEPNWVPYFNLSGAIWDPYGYWGPKENYFVFDEPFYTYGEKRYIVAPSPEASGGVSVKGPYYGIQQFRRDGKSGANKDKLLIKRFDMDMKEVGHQLLVSSEGESMLANMRDFALHHNGIYHLQFPDHSPLKQFQMNIENMLTDEDKLIFGVDFDGSVDKAFVSLREGRIHIKYAEVNSFDALKTSDGETFWLDRSKNIMWVHLKGGRWEGDTDSLRWEIPLYQKLVLHIKLTED